MANPNPFPFTFQVMLKSNHLIIILGLSRVHGCQHINTFRININAPKLIKGTEMYSILNENTS